MLLNNGAVCIDFEIDRINPRREVDGTRRTTIKLPLNDDDNDNDNNDNDRTERRNSRFVTISLRRELSPTRTLKRPGHNRVQINVQYIGISSRATCRVPRGMKGQCSH